MYQGNANSIAAVMPAAIASGLFTSIATFQAPDGLLTGAGQPSGTYVDVVGYVNIACQSAPTSVARISADEAKSTSQVESYNSGHVLLSGYYPDVEAHTEWRVVIDGVIYDIDGAESDSQKQMTRVKVQISTV